MSLCVVGTLATGVASLHDESFEIINQLSTLQPTIRKGKMQIIDYHFQQIKDSQEL